MRLRAAFPAALMLLSALAARAEPAETTCLFGAPTPGFRAVRLDLTEGGSDFLVLQLAGNRATGLFNDGGNWHLAHGIMLVNAATLEIVSYQVQYEGTAPPFVVVSDGDTRTVVPARAPDGPWIHGARRASPDLAPGVYYAIAFGVGSNQWWGGSVYLRGSHTCAPVGTGEVFDFDHTDFEGEQVYVPGAGVAEDIELSTHFGRSLVVGLIDSAVQGGETGEVETCVESPLDSWCQDREIEPFVSVAGDHRFTASYEGVYPLVAIAGAQIDLPVGASS